jgi:hypothetical protein
MQNVLSKALLPVSFNTSASPSKMSSTSSITVHIGNITITANSNAEISKNVASELEKEIRRVLSKIETDRERRKY